MPVLATELRVAAITQFIVATLGAAGVTVRAWWFTDGNAFGKTIVDTLQAAADFH